MLVVHVNLFGMGGRRAALDHGLALFKLELGLALFKAGWGRAVRGHDVETLDALN